MPKTFLDKNNNALYTGYETHEIVANPTLEGDEETLEGLEIGNTKYKVGGGSGTGVILGAELVALIGKHIDVDKLIALVQKYDLDNNERDLFVGLTGNSSDSEGHYSENYLVSFYNNSGTELCILGNYLSQSLDYSEEDSLTTMLTNNKLAIEGVTVQELSFKWATSIFQPTIRKYDNSSIIIIPKQEILDLFVD